MEMLLLNRPMTQRVEKLPEGDWFIRITRFIAVKLVEKDDWSGMPWIITVVQAQISSLSILELHQAIFTPAKITIPHEKT